MAQDSTAVPGVKIDMIHVKKPGEIPAKPETPPADPPPNSARHGDFYRNKRVIRIDLRERVNTPLYFAKYSDAILTNDVEKNHRGKYKEGGMVMAMIQALKAGVIYGVHPENLSKRYLYEDLVQDVTHLEETLEEIMAEAPSNLDDFALADDEPRAAADHAPNQIDHVALSARIDLIVTERFSSGNSRPSQEILYFRLLWNDAHGRFPDCVLTLIPYDQVDEMLDYIKTHNRHNDTAALSVRDFLDLKMFYGRMLNLKESRAFTVEQVKQHKERFFNH